MDMSRLVSFTTVTQDGRQYVAADQVTTLLRALATLYETRSALDPSTHGAEVLSILNKELVYLADTLDIQFIADGSTPDHE